MVVVVVVIVSVVFVIVIIVVIFIFIIVVIVIFVVVLLPEWCHSMRRTGTPEVDCVLTTVEVHQLLQDQGVDFASLPESPADVLLPGEDNEGGQWGLPGGAGGYLEFAMRYVQRVCFAFLFLGCCQKRLDGRFVAKEVLGRPLPLGPLATRALRNADMREVVVSGEGGLAEASTTLRCAAAYGFRNIQTTVRKVKRRACEYQFVEVMACPGACNGGAVERRSMHAIWCIPCPSTCWCHVHPHGGTMSCAACPLSSPADCSRWVVIVSFIRHRGWSGTAPPGGDRCSAAGEGGSGVRCCGAAKEPSRQPSPSCSLLAGGGWGRVCCVAHRLPPP